MGNTPAKILIVDDEPDIELLIRQRFKRKTSDYEFLFARNGEDALTKLDENPEISLVVTDINMPVMDGLTLLSKLNGNNTRVTRAVILSAYGDMPNIRTAMNRGAFDFLTKPIDFQDFEVTINKTLDAIAAAKEGAEATARLMALEQELDIASRIQQSMLPTMPAFPERDDFSLFAEMVPAHQVGGDFYDFFMVEEDSLGFVVGDVSGKGIPASLFMAVSRTLLRATALQGLAPSDCLAYMNRVLGGQGENDMFVTVFYGVLHTDSGRLEFAIGGHNPPYVLSPDGSLKLLDEPAGIVVGLLPDSEYETGRAELKPGDTLFLYTDGVTEAMNPDKKLFTERRLREVIRTLADRAPERIAAEVLAHAKEFTGNNPASDDITLMAIRYFGQQPAK
jgi:sigma-B regulation protein RsbU (phosphoserine phosphatase)